MICRLKYLRVQCTNNLQPTLKCIRREVGLMDRGEMDGYVIKSI